MTLVSKIVRLFSVYLYYSRQCVFLPDSPTLTGFGYIKLLLYSFYNIYSPLIMNHDQGSVKWPPGVYNSGNVDYFNFVLSIVYNRISVVSNNSILIIDYSPIQLPSETPLMNKSAEEEMDTGDI